MTAKYKVLALLIKKVIYLEKTFLEILYRIIDECGLRTNGVCVCDREERFKLVDGCVDWCCLGV